MSVTKATTASGAVAGVRPPGLPRAVDSATLAEFLLARIAEDEATIRDAARHAEATPQEIVAALQAGSQAYRFLGDLEDAGYAVVRQARVLADCEAKRRIIDLLRQRTGEPDDHGQLRAALGLLALPYADHPDYRQEWRP